MGNTARVGPASLLAMDRSSCLNSPIRQIGHPEDEKQIPLSLIPRRIERPEAKIIHPSSTSLQVAPLSACRGMSLAGNGGTGTKYAANRPFATGAGKTSPTLSSSGCCRINVGAHDQSSTFFPWYCPPFRHSSRRAHNAHRRTLNGTSAGPSVDQLLRRQRGGHVAWLPVNH